MKILSRIFSKVTGVVLGIIDYIAVHTIPVILGFVGVVIVAVVTGLFYPLIMGSGVTQQQFAGVTGAIVIATFFFAGVKLFIWIDSIGGSGNEQYHLELSDETVNELVTELTALEQSLTKIRHHQRQVQTAAWDGDTQALYMELNALATEWEDVETRANGINKLLSNVYSKAPVTDDSIMTVWGKVTAHWTELGPNEETPLITVPLPQIETVDDLDTSTLTIVAWAQDRAQFNEDVSLVAADDPETISTAIKYRWSPERISRAIADSQETDYIR